MENGKKILMNDEAAERLGVAAQTLRVWRWRGFGPPYIRLGPGMTARAAYTEEDITAWLASRRFNSTAQETAVGRAMAMEGR